MTTTRPPRPRSRRPEPDPEPQRPRTVVVAVRRLFDAETPEYFLLLGTTLFLVAGLIERQVGSTAISELGGLAKVAPVLGVLFFVPAMNLAGIPPMSGFLGKVGLSGRSEAAAYAVRHLEGAQPAK